MMDEEFQKRVQEAAARFRAGESDVEEVDSPAGLLRMIRDADAPDGFRIETQVEGETFSMAIRSFHPAPERPDDYPEDLPFLADCGVMVNTTARNVTWLDPKDPGNAFDHIVQECKACGWQQVDLHPVIAGSGDQRQAEFTMPGRERTVMLLVRGGRAHLALMDRTAPADPEAT